MTAVEFVNAIEDRQHAVNGAAHIRVLEAITDPRVLSLPPNALGRLRAEGAAGKFRD